MFRLALLCLFGLSYSRVSAEQGTEAIVGGEYARGGDFKYYVALHFGTKQCGGAIIDDRYVLTAAHCVTDLAGHIKSQWYTIIAGTHNLRDRHNAASIHVETVYIPNNYVRNNNLHDIAVLKLKNSLHLSQHHNKFEKVNLPKPDAHYDNVCATVTGFGDQEIQVRKNNHGGLEEFGGKTNGKLKFTNVRVISNERCQNLNHHPILPTNICGQALQNHNHHFSGVCNGDSGGPLVYGNEIIGISSLSPIGCNESSTAALYTRVSSYLNFIYSVIHGHPGNNVVWANVPH